MMEMSDEFRVHEEHRWTSHADILDARDKGGAGGREWHSVSWVLRKGITSEESSQLSLVFKCRLVVLKASRLTSLKTNAIFCFITVNSKTGFQRCSPLFAEILHSKSRTTEGWRHPLKLSDSLD